MEKFNEYAALMTVPQLEAVIAEYVELLNGHVLTAEELRGKIRVLRDNHRARLVK